eukprot:COSAG01_NODE_1587_length_9809_cov_13.149022_2_plen_69_part_00
MRLCRSSVRRQQQQSDISLANQAVQAVQCACGYGRQQQQSRPSHTDQQAIREVDPTTSSIRYISGSGL